MEDFNNNFNLKTYVSTKKEVSKDSSKHKNNTQLNLVNSLSTNDRIIKCIEALEDYELLIDLKNLTLENRDIICDDIFLSIYSRLPKLTNNAQELKDLLKEIEEYNLPASAVLLDRLINCLGNHVDKKRILEKKLSSGFQVTSQNCKELIAATTSQGQFEVAHRDILRYNFMLDARYFYSVLKTATVFGGIEAIYDSIPKDYLDDNTYRMLLERLDNNSDLIHKISRHYALSKLHHKTLNDINNCYLKYSKGRLNFGLQHDLLQLKQVVYNTDFNEFSDAKYYKKSELEATLHSVREFYMQNKTDASLEKHYYINGILYVLEAPESIDCVHIKQCSDIAEEEDNRLLNQYLEGFRYGLELNRSLVEKALASDNKVNLCLYFEDSKTKDMFELYLKVKGFVSVDKNESGNNSSLRYFATSDLDAFVKYSTMTTRISYYAMIVSKRNKISFEDFLESNPKYSDSLLSVKSKELKNGVSFRFFNEKSIVNLDDIFLSIKNSLRIMF